MKNVIKINRLIAACMLAGSLSIYSCSDFLNQEPKTSLTEQEAFSDLKNIIPTVDGLYTAFRESKSGREGLTFSLLGLDETRHSTDGRCNSSQPRSLQRFIEFNVHTSR